MSVLVLFYLITARARQNNRRSFIFIKTQQYFEVLIEFTIVEYFIFIVYTPSSEVKNNL